MFAQKNPVTLRLGRDTRAHAGSWFVILQALAVWAPLGATLGFLALKNVDPAVMVIQALAPVAAILHFEEKAALYQLVFAAMMGFATILALHSVKYN